MNMLPKFINVLLVTADSALLDSFVQAASATNQAGFFRPFNIQPANHPTEAKKLLAEQSYDLLAVDYAQPDATSLVTAVRRQYPHLPVIAILPSRNDEHITSILTAGAQDYIIRDELDPTLLSRLFEYNLRRNHPLSLPAPHTDQTVHRYNQRLRLLYQIDQAILAAHNPQNIARLVVQQIRNLIPARRASIITFDWEAGVGRIIAADSDLPTHIIEGTEIPVGVFAITEDLLRGNVYFVPHTLHHTPHFPLLDQLVKENVLCFMSAPLIAQGKLIGLLNVGAEEPHAFTQEHLEIAREAASLITIAIHQAELNRQTIEQTRQLQRQEHFLRVLNEITRIVVSTMDLQEMLQLLADRLGELLNADGCHITLWDETTGQVVPTAASGPYRESYPGVTPPKGELTLTESLMREQRPLPVPDPFNSPYISPKIAAYFPGIKSLLGLPLLANGHKLGAVLLAYYQPHEFSTEEIAAAEQAAGQIALAIFKARLLETEREQRRLAETLLHASTTLTSTLDWEELLDKILDEVAKLVPYDTAVFLLLENNKAILARQHGYQTRLNIPLETLQQHIIDISQAPHWQIILQTGEPYIIPDVTQYPDWIPLEGTEHIRSWLGAPITVHGELVALISLDKTEPNFYTPEHAQRLMAFIRQAALAMQNANLYRTTKRHLNELVAISTLATAGAQATSEDELIERVTTLIGQTFYLDNFGILLYNEKDNFLYPHPSYHTLKPIKMPPFISANQGIVGRAIRTGRPVRVGDVTKDPDYFESDPNTRSELCVPLIAGHKIIGVINAESHRPHAFTDADERLLLTLANQMMTAIEKIRLLQAEQKRRQEAETLRQVAASLTSTLNLEQVLENVLDQLRRVISYDSASILLFQGNEILLSAARGLPTPETMIGRTFPAQNSLIEEIRETRRPLVLADAQKDGRFQRWANTDYVRGWIGVPLIVRDEVIGVLTIDNRQPNAYSQTDAELAQAFANHAATALENARLYASEQEARLTSETLRAANQALTQTLDLESILETLLDYLAKLVPYDTANVMLLEGDHDIVLYALRNYEKWTQPTAVRKHRYDLRQNKIFQQIFLQKKAVLIEDTHAHPDWEIKKEISYIRNWLGVPLITSGKVIGLFSLDKSQPGFFTQRHIELAKTLSAQASIMIQNARLYEATQRNAHELAITRDILQKLNATTYVQQAFPAIGQILRRATNCTRVSITLLEENQKSALLYPLDESSANVRQGIRLYVEDSSATSDILAGKVHLTPDLSIEQDKAGEQMLYAAGIRSRINLPLHAQGTIIGSLNLAWKQTAGFDVQQLPLLQQIADMVALAIERSRFLQQVEKRATDMSIINDLSREISGLLDVRALCTRVVHTLHHQFHYPVVGIFVRDPISGDAVLEAAMGAGTETLRPGEYRIPPGEGLIGKAIATGQTQIINDTRENPEFVSPQKHVVLSELVLPVKAGSQILGVINIDSDRTGAFGQDDLALLSLIADQLAVALGKARLFSETQQRASELEALADVSAALRETNTVSEMLPLIIQKTIEIVNGRFGSIFLLDPQTNELVARATYPHDPEMINRRYQVGEGITGYVAQTGEVYVSENIKDDPKAKFYPQERPYIEQLQSTIGIPLRTQDKVIGVIHVGTAEKHPFDRNKIRLLTAVSEIAGNALDRALFLETLEHRVAERTRELAEANQQLQALDRMKSKFVSDVSHELRTPITNLNLYLDLIERAGKEKQERYLQVLRQQANRLTTLIEDILNLSRMDLGKAQISFTAVSLNDLITQIVEIYQARAEAANLQLTTTLQPDLPPVRGEPNQLSQVITNLLANALNYTPAGSIHLCTNWQEGDQMVCFRISDTGIGIDPEDQEHLFERFYRGKHAAQSNIPGTGLGLAIVKEIIDLHQGQIQVNSEPGQGTTFYVWLPVFVADTAE
ncbi:MAG: GAF domain-containing protein [Chloroflexi bacterium]|nr:MAG: GAF domain-containing protein [Chloroflexota bacterium]